MHLHCQQRLQQSLAPHCFISIAAGIGAAKALLVQVSVFCLQAACLDPKLTWIHIQPQGLPWPDSSKCRASLLSTASRGCRRSVTGTCQRRLCPSCLSIVDHSGKKSHDVVDLAPHSTELSAANLSKTCLPGVMVCMSASLLLSVKNSSDRPEGCHRRCAGSLCLDGGQHDILHVQPSSCSVAGHACTDADDCGNGHQLLNLGVDPLSHVI